MKKIKEVPYVNKGCKATVEKLKVIVPEAGLTTKIKAPALVNYVVSIEKGNIFIKPAKARK